MGNKYRTIYSQLVNKIVNGEYVVNDLLPSENELMKLYNVSRDTVRKSLNMLTQEGYIYRSKGKGSIVLDTNRFEFPVSGIVSFKEIGKKLGKEFSTEVKVLECKSQEKNVCDLLKIDTEENVWKIFRTRKIDNENIILDKDYILKKYVPYLDYSICENSIYEYIENVYDLKIVYAKKQITVEKYTEEDEKYLDLNGYNMVVVIRSFTYLKNAVLFQYTESRHRPDKFVFVDFATRDKFNKIK